MRFKIFVIIGLLFSCSEKQDSPEFPLINIYKEILVTREMYQDTSIANKKIDSIFAHHGINERVFRTELINLSKNRDDFSKVIDSLRSLVRSELDSIKRNKLKEMSK